MLSPHLLMNIKVVDETGRQLGMGRQVATLKANLGGKARGAFQALAQLKLGTPPASQASANEPPSSPAAGELKGVGGAKRICCFKRYLGQQRAAVGCPDTAYRVVVWPLARADGN